MMQSDLGLEVGGAAVGLEGCGGITQELECIAPTVPGPGVAGVFGQQCAEGVECLAMTSVYQCLAAFGQVVGSEGGDLDGWRRPIVACELGEFDLGGPSEQGAHEPAQSAHPSVQGRAQLGPLL